MWKSKSWREGEIFIQNVKKYYWNRAVPKAIYGE